jgi:hypothetical protein
MYRWDSVKSRRKGPENRGLIALSPVPPKPPPTECPEEKKGRFAGAALIVTSFSWSDAVNAPERPQALCAGFYEEHPPRAEYLLTPKGRELGPVMKLLRAWGEKHTGRASG